MSTAIAKTESPAMTREQVDLLKRTVARGATDDEFALFLHICKRTGLDPFAKQIHCLKRRENVDGQWVEKMSFQTGIDGYVLIADRTGKYAPGREPTYEYDDKGHLVSATAYVKKQTEDGTWHEFGRTAHYREYVALKRDGSPNRMWHDKPHIMLAKCAEALALRRAFPAELSGVYTAEEMDRSNNSEHHEEHPLPAAITNGTKEDSPAVALFKRIGWHQTDGKISKYLKDNFGKSRLSELNPTEMDTLVSQLERELGLQHGDDLFSATAKT